MMASLSKVVPVSNKTNEVLNKLSDNWSFWSEGSVSIGKTGDTSIHHPLKTLVAKVLQLVWMISKNKLYGYALRLGRDRVDVGSSGSWLDTTSNSLSFYGTFLKMMKDLSKEFLV